jgi:hypothetical protein
MAFGGEGGVYRLGGSCLLRAAACFAGLKDCTSKGSGPGWRWDEGTRSGSESVDASEEGDDDVEVVDAHRKDLNGWGMVGRCCILEFKGRSRNGSLFNDIVVGVGRI